VKQQSRNLREKLEDKLAAVEARSRLSVGDGPVTSTTTVKPPKFHGATAWAVFRRQFVAGVLQNN